MASTIKVDNVQNQPGTNIINKCGTTITLGASSDTVALAAGASQTGFGRTGTVDWQTGDIKTGDFTAATGKGYFVNTTSGTITATLPASPTAGDIVGLKDYALTFDTNSMFIGRNSQPINGTTGTTLEISTEGATIMLVYVDGVKGWVPTQDDASALIAVTPTYIAATGGTPTTVGDYKVHTFTGPGTLCVSAIGNPAGSTKIDYLVVAGGAGGGWDRGGGAGAGGFRESKQTGAPWSASPLATCVGITAAVQGYPIVVGGGGAGGSGPAIPTSRGTSGDNSSFSTITSAGGGGGGAANPSSPTGPGVAGGSGGGAGNRQGCGTMPGGAGNTPPVSPSQGNTGGPAVGPGPVTPGGGGGGATAVGTTATASVGNGVAGGAGATTTISNVSTAYAGGGGGGASYCCGSTCRTGGPGGVGGGGAGGASPGGNVGIAGTVNTGGGGGGGGNPSGHGPSIGGTGGSGIVIIRYKFQ